MSENVFDSENGSVGIGRHPSTVLPFDISNPQDVHRVSKVITDITGNLKRNFPKILEMFLHNNKYNLDCCSYEMLSI